ncbi:MAG: hypothetical protein EBW38_15415 [Rhodobacteraceae bacterium]|nr:hypothetical protein [Paracoccaceae bacterium]
MFSTFSIVKRNFQSRFGPQINFLTATAVSIYVDNRESLTLTRLAFETGTKTNAQKTSEEIIL